MKPTLNRRALMLHDGVAFMLLLFMSVALFGMTLFLFKSFQGHRQELARQWTERGRLALAQGKPEEAVNALRTALSYAPDERPDQLLLAQALASAGHTEEATNYFLNLWDARPGDGFINLQLARLARKRGDSRQATDYYRASIFGSWEGDGVVRRRDVRLELADFLIEQKQFSEARNALFTVAGNAPNDANLNLEVGEKLQAAGDLNDALTFDDRAAASDPHLVAALYAAGRVAYAEGDFAKAESLLHRTLDEMAKKPGQDDAQKQEAESLEHDAKRILELTLSRDQPPGERADHLLEAAQIAQTRLKSCLVQSGVPAAAASTAPDTGSGAVQGSTAGTASGNSSAGVPTPLGGLSARWATAAAGSRAGRRALLDNANTQDVWAQLIFETEQKTAKVCGAPTGDDALLLQMAVAAPGRSGAAGKD